MGIKMGSDESHFIVSLIVRKKHTIETRMTPSVLKQDPKHIKVYKKIYFFKQNKNKTREFDIAIKKHEQIFRVSLILKQHLNNR